MKEIRIDGGATANGFLMQFQADILGVPVVIQEAGEGVRSCLLAFFLPFII